MATGNEGTRVPANARGVGGGVSIGSVGVTQRVDKVGVGVIASVVGCGRAWHDSSTPALSKVVMTLIRVNAREVDGGIGAGLGGLLRHNLPAQKQIVETCQIFVRR